MTFTDKGRNEIRDWLNGDATTAPTHIAWGTGTTDSTKADIALETETVRNAFSSTLKGLQEVQFEALLDSTQGNGTIISEMGLFNLDVGGDMFQRQNFAGLTKTASLVIQSTVIVSIT